MKNVAKKAYTNVSDLAHYLVVRVIPFREDHKIIGNILLFAINQLIQFEKMSLV
ncbi:hypothetical protein [Pantoea sp. Mhis]|uniref:hypothetical protein n=1 Tax=Pantoea sp. Mhis TaxID=2576759 RepID=UPI001357E452|nr:hypothetical protein [Pantoea sp. Mhis]